MLWLQWTPKVIMNAEFHTPKVTLSKLSGTEYGNTRVTEVRLTVENSLEQFVIRH